MAVKTAGDYRCTECGWTALKWVGRCGECQSWGTVQHRGESGGISARPSAAPRFGPAAVSIAEVPATAHERRPTGIGEFDRVLGGGIVPGAAILLSGEPGVGKSTLLLEVAANAARSGERVLYISGEETAAQVRLRAERTGALEPSLFLADETDLATVLGHIETTEPSLLIVDSVQTISSDQLEGYPGGPAQVREVAGVLVRTAKQRGLPLILVGHVTKDGAIAGPRMLEHLVDVVCHFEGDQQGALRFVRALKNRFGSVAEVGCFVMLDSGIQELADPSGLFLNAREGSVIGVCPTIAMEGRRALPVEIQALVVKSSAPQPRRVVNGVDSSRVAMILAVLERRAGLKLSDSDVYVSTVAGIRLVEPAADLAIALAIASAATNRPVPTDVAAFGELSLTGELRPVSAGERRLAEAHRLGFPRSRTVEGQQFSALAAELLPAKESSAT